MFDAEHSWFVIFFIISVSGLIETTERKQMGNSLYNKIYLGRSTGFASRRFQGVLAVGGIIVAGLIWVALRALR
jgi:hypothetical protein